MGSRTSKQTSNEQKVKIGNKRMKKDLGSEVGQCESEKELLIFKLRIQSLSIQRSILSLSFEQSDTAGRRHWFFC